MTKYQMMSRVFFLNRQGDKFQLTQGQSEIFRIIYEKSVTRGAIAAYTQYGKSDVASMAIIMSAVRRKEKILIVSPSLKQSMIIMGDVITHLFDDSDITEMLEYEAGSLERLKEERSKQRITFRTGSEVFILTADADTVSKEAKNLMGFGATEVIVDESSLIPDLLYSKIIRMVGGVERGKIVQMGNTFERNHFYRALNSERYEKLVIDYRQGISEGRVAKDFISEAKEEMTEVEFGILYECRFPETGREDAVIPYDWITRAVDSTVGGEITQAGIDIARFGRDKSVYCFRKGGRVVHMVETDHLDTMSLVGWLREYLDRDKPERIGVDVVGLGAGVYDRLEELGYQVYPVNVGEAATDEENKKKFFNLRAEIFWNLRDLFRQNLISIQDDGDLVKQLSELRYSFSSERKIRIEDKEDMKKRLGRSPDKADALSLAFFDLTGREPELYIV